MKRVLAAVALALVACAAIGLWHGVRYPPPRWDPAPRPHAAESAQGFGVRAEGAYFVDEVSGELVFRAFTPAPVLEISAQRALTARVALTNVHPEATASIEGPVSQRARTNARHLEATLAAGQSARVAFAFPRRDVYHFAAIGDAGGLGELAWCIRRARALGADFLLHLGDVDYTPDAFGSAKRILAEARIPVYAAIGNHDVESPFPEFGAEFTRLFGPRNFVFTLAGVTFLDLDTSADTMLPSRGERGRLLRRVAAEPKAERSPLIVFTHRPLRDPRTHSVDDEGHALNSRWESGWLRRQLLALGADALLTGHIHESHEFDDGGLHTYIAGEGLGLADVQANAPVASILVGEFAPGGPVRFHWEPLEMPTVIFRNRARNALGAAPIPYPPELAPGNARPDLAPPAEAPPAPAPPDAGPPEMVPSASTRQVPSAEAAPP